MLNCLTRLKRSDWLFVLALAAFCVFWFLAQTGRLPLPVSSQHQQSEETKSSNTLPESTQDIAAETVAHYTEVLAWVTVCLVVVGFLQVVLLFRTNKTAREGLKISDKQARISESQTELTRLQYFSAHRPAIVPHSFEPTHTGTADEKIAVQITYFNKGASLAKVIEIGAKITRLDLPPQAGLALPVISIRPKETASGSRGQFLVESDFHVAPEIVHKRLGPHESDPRIFCIGRVIYADKIGRKHETGFCRVFCTEPERWEKTDNPEYEYAY